MTTPTDGEWMHADDALAFLGTSHADAVDAICSRAYNGLIMAKAEQYIDAGERCFDDVELPRQFWWSSGEITGYWQTGDLETTPPDCRGRLRAFGVTFRRSDIERMRPAASATNARPPAGSGVLTSSPVEQTSSPIPVASRRVFIVHGRDEGPREAIARFLERLGFEAIILHEQANQSRTVIEKIEGYSDVGFAVVLLTPDD
jgi:Predicted nucleotide-binding protein containing TIR-like domain